MPACRTPSPSTSVWQRPETPPPLRCGRSIPRCSWRFASVNWVWLAGDPSSAPSNWQTANRRRTTSASSSLWPSRRGGMRAACRRSGRTADPGAPHDVQVVAGMAGATGGRRGAGPAAGVFPARPRLRPPFAPGRGRGAALDASRRRAAAAALPRCGLPAYHRRGDPRRAGEERPHVRGNSPVSGGTGLRQPHAAHGGETPGRGRAGDARSPAGMADARARPPGARGTRPGP